MKFNTIKKNILEEVVLFHDRLMNEMENRIIEIENNNPLPNVYIDLQQLKNEQVERKKSLQIALNTKPEITNWNDVHNAIALINNKKKGPRKDRNAV